MEDLVPVLVGGLLTLGGTVAAALGTVIRDVVQRRSEERKRRANKFEELVAAVYDFDHWLDRLKDRFAFGADILETVSPFAKVQSISAVYFPQFSTLADDLDEAATDYRRWMIGAGEKRLNKDPAYMDGFKEAYDPYKRDGSAHWVNKPDIGLIIERGAGVVHHIKSAAHFDRPLPINFRYPRLRLRLRSAAIYRLGLADSGGAIWLLNYAFRQSCN